MRSAGGAPPVVDVHSRMIAEHRSFGVALENFFGSSLHVRPWHVVLGQVGREQTVEAKHSHQVSEETHEGLSHQHSTTHTVHGSGAQWNTAACCPWQPWTMAVGWVHAQHDHCQ